MFVPDLDNCHKEPIHIPGKIQDHGFMIVVDGLYNISYCSENVLKFFGVTAESLLNQSAGILDGYLRRSSSSLSLHKQIRALNRLIHIL
jgi:chemotaxis family two-component system sensor kinase Cph1